MLLKKEILENNKILKEEIKTLEKKLKDNIRFDENRFKELFEAREEIERLKNIINNTIKYISIELLYSNVEWYRENGGNISGSDLPYEYILNILDILKGEDKE